MICILCCMGEVLLPSEPYSRRYTITTTFVAIIAITIIIIIITITIIIIIIIIITNVLTTTRLRCGIVTT